VPLTYLNIRPYDITIEIFLFEVMDADNYFQTPANFPLHIDMVVPVIDAGGIGFGR
jgi:hypothetical protein